jgi:xanthine dehydrogenase molybdopterin-binding subunit B
MAPASEPNSYLDNHALVFSQVRAESGLPHRGVALPLGDKVSRVARVVGRNVRRKDADAKVTGAAQYIDDLTFPGMLFGRTIRSTVPRGRINAIRLDFNTAGFTVVDFRDVPGRNIVALIDDDQPCLAEHETYHYAEPILLLAHA